MIAETPDDLLTMVVRWVEDSENEGADWREKSERDRDYYDGRQITDEEAQDLKERKQPIIAFNLIQQKVDYFLGLEKQQRSDPKAYPRNPQDEQAGEAATDALRYVCDVADMQMIASQCWENMIVEGAGGCDVCVKALPGGEMEITIEQVHWDRMIWDPHSRERDFSDAKFLGIVIWMDESDLLARWPDAQDLVTAAYETVSQTGTFDDRPRHGLWADSKRKRLRVVQLYWRDGEGWKSGVFTRGGWLEDAAPVVYVDEHGEPECPLIFASAYVNRENARYGAVRNLIDPQDEINIRHRKAVHALSVRQVKAEQGAVENVDVARRELAKPDGYVEVAPGMVFEVLPTQDMAAGQWQLLQEAKGIFQQLGPNAALMGKQGKEASGRAIALSQQGGVMEIGAMLDTHRHWRRRVYRAIWNRIKQYWTAEKWVRVTDDERNIRFVGLNTPAVDEMGQPVIEGYDEAGQPVMAKQNDVSRMHVDIVVEEGPDIATLQIEQFETLAGLAKAGLPIPPDVLIQASTLRNKDQILERMQQMMQPPPQAPDPAMLEVQRKAQRDQGDLALGAARLQLDQQKAMADVVQRAQQPQLPAGVPA